MMTNTSSYMSVEHGMESVLLITVGGLRPMSEFA